MAKAKKKSEALAKKEETAVEVYDYGDESGEGYEGQSADDTLIPFITILQSNSPQCDDEENFPTARPGKLFNTASEEILDEVTFIPSLTEHLYIEWRPRKEGGGFVARHDIRSDVVKDAQANQDFGKYKTENGNDLVETFYVYGVLYDDDGPQGGVVFSFVSTKIKPYKSWNTKMRGFQLNVNGRKQIPPIFAHRVRVTTVSQENQHGKFYNFVLRPAEKTIRDSLLPPGDPRLEAARSFKELIQAGDVKADVSKSESSSSGSNEEGEFEDF